MINNSNFVNAGVSIIVLVIVYFLEYGLKMQPCEMCIIQRYPYFLLIALSAISIIFNTNQTFVFILKFLCLVTVLSGFIYVLLHVGIERGLIEGFTECTSSLPSMADKSDLLQSLEQAPLTRCDEPVILLNFISVAESNLLMMGLLLIYNIFVSIKKK